MFMICTALLLALIAGAEFFIESRTLSPVGSEVKGVNLILKA